VDRGDRFYYIGILFIILGLSIAACGDDTNSPAMDPVIARVLDKDIRRSEKMNLDGIIFGSLLQKYTKDNAIAPTQADIDAFVERSKQQKIEQHKNWEAKKCDVLKQLESNVLPDVSRKELTSKLEMYDRFLRTDVQMADYEVKHPEQSRKTEAEIATRFVQAWKVNQALYKQYGGRVIFQQAGVEPLDAYREFLRDQEKAGAFQIMDKQYEASFWNYFTNDTMHSFYTKEDGDKFMTTPWWLMSEPQEE
jgi:hypothetical protein